MTRQVRRHAINIALAAFTLAASGCATLPDLSVAKGSGAGQEAVPASYAQPEPYEPQDGPYITIEVQPSEGKYQRVRAPLRGETYVQDALDHVKAQKKFKKMDVVVHRRDPNTGQSQRMGSIFDSQSKRIDMRYDYALHPGDIVVITEDPASIFDEAFSRLLPLGMGKRR